MCETCREATLPGRRGLMAAGLGLLAAAPLARPALAQPARAASGPDEALERLRQGNARYVSGDLRERDLSPRRTALAEGQRPFATILGCSDSRVAPELAFDQRPGDLFVVRIAGNYVTPGVQGSIEFAVAELEAPLVVVLGHSDCGAVTATLEKLRQGERPPGRIGDLVDGLRPGIEAALSDPDRDGATKRAVEANVRHTVARLREADPVLSEAVSKGEARVVGAVYELGEGRVRFL